MAIQIRFDGGPEDDLAAHGVTGWQYLWAKWVYGSNPDRHCAAGLLGHPVLEVRPGAPVGQWLELAPPDDQWPFLYVCGVARRGGWVNNFHLALRPADPAAKVVAFTYNRYRVTVRGVERVEIGHLPDGYLGRDRSFTTCRNWQFGIQQFGDEGRRYTRRQPARAAAVAVARPPAPRVARPKGSRVGGRRVSELQFALVW